MFECHLHGQFIDFVKHVVFWFNYNCLHRVSVYAHMLPYLYLFDEPLRLNNVALDAN